MVCHGDFIFMIKEISFVNFDPVNRIFHNKMSTFQGNLTCCISYNRNTGALTRLKWLESYWLRCAGVRSQRWGWCAWRISQLNLWLRVSVIVKRMHLWGHPGQTVFVDYLQKCWYMFDSIDRSFQMSTEHAHTRILPSISIYETNLCKSKICIINTKRINQ